MRAGWGIFPDAMPIYDYKCRQCGGRCELLVKPGDTPTCPSCDGSDLERAFPLSATVSTPKSKQRSLAGARARANAVKKEKDSAHSEYMRNHIKDHSEG